MGDDARKDFCALNDTYFPKVWAYSVSRIGRQTAEEIVSETFAIAWRRRTSIPPDPLPWLLRVASNVMHESFRAQTRQQLLEAEMREWTANAPSLGQDIADSVIDRAEALAALGSLSESDQELLTLVAWHGLAAGQGVTGAGVLASYLFCSAASGSAPA